MTSVGSFGLARYECGFMSLIERDRAGEKSDQVEDPGQGRTCDRGHQAGVRLRQGALSRAQQEHLPSAGHLRFGQFVHGATPSATRRTGIEGPQPGWQTMQAPQCPIKNRPITRTTARRPNRHASHPDVSPLFRRSLAVSLAPEAFAWRAYHGGFGGANDHRAYHGGAYGYQGGTDNIGTTAVTP